MTSQNGNFSTTNTSLATYLIIEGFELLSIDYTEPHYKFEFTNEPDNIQEYASKYITGKALVDPATFTRVNRKLIRLLKGKLQWGGE